MEWACQYANARSISGSVLLLLLLPPALPEPASLSHPNPNSTVAPLLPARELMQPMSCSSSFEAPEIPQSGGI